MPPYESAHIKVIIVLPKLRSYSFFPRLRARDDYIATHLRGDIKGMGFPNTSKTYWVGMDQLAESLHLSPNFFAAYLHLDLTCPAIRKGSEVRLETLRTTSREKRGS